MGYENTGVFSNQSYRIGILYSYLRVEYLYVVFYVYGLFFVNRRNVVWAF